VTRQEEEEAGCFDEAGPPDVTLAANASTADDAKPVKGGGAEAEKEGGASAKLERVKKRVESDSVDDANPAAKGVGCTCRCILRLRGVETDQLGALGRLRHKSAGGDK
jgi:hypothetical protein